jgi:hypothetical protein
MNRNRRDILKSGSLALLGGGLIRRMDKIDGMQTSAAGGSLAEMVKSRSSGQRKTVAGSHAGRGRAAGTGES